MLTANVKILGYAIAGATVNFTSTSSNVFFSPSLVNTNSDGNSTTYAFSAEPITGETLTATYANCSATNTITFVKPIYLTFTSNTIGNSNYNLQYQSEVVNVNSNQYPVSQLPAQIMAVSGTAQQYAFNDILPSTLTATRYNYISTTGDCGASQISQTISPSTSCNVIGNYGTQYFLTTSVNPSNGGTLTPSSQWVDSGNQITINAVANTGYIFLGFTGTGAGSYTGTASSAPITLNNPITETANFKQEYPVTIYTNPSAASNYWGAVFSINANKNAGEYGVTYTSVPPGNSIATAMLPPGTPITYLCTYPWYGTGGYYFSGWYVNGQFVSSNSCFNPGITTTTGATSIEADYQVGTLHTVTFTIPGVHHFTTPAGAPASTQYQISIVGAGGGGGGGSAPGEADSFPGTGAGGGAYIVANAIEIQPSTTLTVTVGSGGAGGIWTTSVYGATGGSSSVSGPGFALTAGGGAGGQSESQGLLIHWINPTVGYCAPINGGTGGSASISGSNIDVLTNDQGQPGATNNYCTSDPNNGGNSGGNQGTGGASFPYQFMGLQGNPGGSYGGGGAGGPAPSFTYVSRSSELACGSAVPGTGVSCATVGGTGGNGMVSITWFGPP